MEAKHLKSWLRNFFPPAYNTLKYPEFGDKLMWLPCLSPTSPGMTLGVIEVLERLVISRVEPIIDPFLPPKQRVSNEADQR